MKRKILLTISTFLLCFFVSSNLKAQAPQNYFIGKWDVLVKETPQGNVVIPFRFELVDGKIKGYASNPETKEEQELATLEVKETEMTASFSMAGYDLVLTLTKVDDDHANGKLLDMFDAEGTRKKE